MKHDHFTGTLDSAISQLRCNPQIVDAAEWKKKKKNKKPRSLLLGLRSQD